MEWQPVGFVGSLFVSTFILSGCVRTTSGTHVVFDFVGITGSVCLIVYSGVNRVWPPMITNLVLVTSLVLKFARRVSCRRLSARNASRAARSGELEAAATAPAPENE